MKSLRGDKKSVASGDGSSSNPFQLENGRFYGLNTFITSAPTPLLDPKKVKLYITGPFVLDYVPTRIGDFALFNKDFTVQTTSFASGDEVDFDAVIQDARSNPPQDKAITIRLEYTYTNPNPDKYEDVTVSVYIRTFAGS